MASFEESIAVVPVFTTTAKRYQGTYRAIARVEWTTLLAKEFGQPDWESLYPINRSKGELSPVTGAMVYSELATKSQLLSPRMACKLFHDGLHIIKKGEESPKFIQDRIPEVAHKYFKKKQWRKQFYEAMRRVCCRLSIGLGFRPNCLAEDAFIHVILGMNYELGWRRIAEFIDILPEWERDRDFSRVLKFGANEEVGNLLRGVDAPPVATSGKSRVLSIDPNLKMDVKTGWFKCYDMSSAHLFDHIVRIEEDEADKWSVTTGDTEVSGRDRGLSNASLDSIEELTVSGSHHPIGRPRGLSNPSTPSSRKGRAPSLGTLEENVNALLGDD